MNEIAPDTLPLRDSQPVDTSGTVGATFIDTISVIEHAARRCNVQPTSLTPENLETGKNNLFFILSKLANRGVNLWAVDQFYVPFVVGKARYPLPTSTEQILKIVRRTPILIPTTLVGGPAITRKLSSVQPVGLIGFNLKKDTELELVLETTADGVNWQLAHAFKNLKLSAGRHWYPLSVVTPCLGVRIRKAHGGPLVDIIEDCVIAGSYTDTQVLPMNRDTYTDLSDKNTLGSPSTYYFEKKIESAVSLWPVPKYEYEHMMLWRQRAVQDVGNLSDRLEIPNRWYDAIIWSLAKNLAYELPNITDARIAMVESNAAAAVNDAELGESDGAPMRMQPNISGYTA